MTGVVSMVSTLCENHHSVPKKFVGTTTVQKENVVPRDRTTASLPFLQKKHEQKIDMSSIVPRTERQVELLFPDKVEDRLENCLQTESV